MSISAGTRLGPYEILVAIGAGGMGEVYKAKDTRLDRIVAVKTLLPHIAAAPDLRECFEREARTISQLIHVNICTLFDVGEQDQTAFLVMEYFEGETLAARIAKGPIPVEQALPWAIQIASPLNAAHRQGILHRDLKPGNVMLRFWKARFVEDQNPRPLRSSQQRLRGSIEHWGAAYRISAKCTVSSI